MADLIVIAVIAIVVGAASNYIVKSKKSGVKCIGCPSGCNCSHDHSEGSRCGGSCGGDGGCGCHTK